MMKRKIIVLKSALSAFALALVLLGGTSLPGTGPNGPEIPNPFPIEGEEPDLGDEDGGIQPMSDLDAPVKQFGE